MMGGNVGTVDDNLGCFIVCCVNEEDVVAIDTAGSLTLLLQLFVLLVLPMSMLPVAILLSKLLPPPPPPTTTAAISSSGLSWFTNSKKSRKGKGNGKQSCKVKRE